MMGTLALAMRLMMAGCHGRSRTQPSRRLRSLTAPEGNSPKPPPERSCPRARRTPMMLSLVAAVRFTPVGVTEMNEGANDSTRLSILFTMIL